MGKLNVFNFTTLNGYFEGPGRDLSWHSHGGAQADYAIDMLDNDGTLLFGRVTYEQMASYWPTPIALEQNAAMAQGMNAADKVVFSRTLRELRWPNSRLAEGNLEQAVARLKQGNKDLCLLGSGSILTQLAQADLIDEYSFMIDPVLLGAGTPVCQGLERKLDLTLCASKVFDNGIVLLTYRPKRAT